MMLEGLVLVAAIFGNVNNIWKNDLYHGGIWGICAEEAEEGSQQEQAGKAGKCVSYGEDDAKSLGQKFKEVLGARAMMLITLILGIPMIIILIIACAIGCCTPAPFAVGAVFAVLQLTAIVAGGALMAHGLIASAQKKHKIKPDWCFYMVWLGVAFALVLAIVMCSACCKCWEKCDKKHNERGGSTKK